jgi:hypothetical protein
MSHVVYVSKNHSFLSGLMRIYLVKVQKSCITYYPVKVIDLYVALGLNQPYGSLNLIPKNTSTTQSLEPLPITFF